MNGSLRKLLIGSCSLLLFAEPVRAVEPHTRITQYGHSVWHIEDGVLSAAPTAIVQSKDGYIWVGTESGLLRFDGVRFVPWSTPELTDARVTTLLAASDGTLWIGTPTLIASWKDGKANVFSVRGFANTIVEDHQGKIWVAVSRSPDRKPICEVSTGKAHCFGGTEGLPFPYAGGMGLDRNGHLVVASASRVACWSPLQGLLSSFAFEELESSKELHGISAVQPEADGSVLVSVGFKGKNMGLQRLNEGHLEPYNAAQLDGASLEAQTTYRDKFGSLWIGTYSDGLYRVTATTTEHYTSRDGLSGNSVRDFREDREGNLWVSTEGGIDFFRDLKVVTWSGREGLPAGFVSSVLAVRSGSVFVGTHTNLLILRDGQVTMIDAAHGLPGKGVTALLEDTSDLIWMGVGDELVRYDGEKFTVVKRPDGQATGVIYALALSGDASVWALTAGPKQELLHIKDGRIESILHGSSQASRLVADAKSGIWLTERARIGHFSEGHMQWFPMSVPLGVAGSLLLAPDGAILGSGPEGVWRFKDGHIQSIGVANGLPCKSSNGLGFSEKQELLIRTSCGLIRIEPDALQAWTANPHSAVPNRLIDTYDGAHLSYGTFSPQMSLASDGRVWIAGQSSIQVFDAERASSNLIAPPIHVERVIADRVELEAKPGLALPPLTRDIEIQYTALSFAVPQKVRFRYMLEGRDAAWHEPGSRRAAFYQDLKPGRYRFHVVAANNDGVWNTDGDVQNFTIQPAWFQTTWFFVLCCMAISLLLFVLYQLRIRSISRAISARFDERLNERTRMALELHDTFLQTVQGSKMVADDALDANADQVRMRHALEKLSVWLEQAISEGRAALHALRVTTTERNHLAQFLECTAKEHCGSKSISVALTVIGDARDLHPIVRDEITRIAEEAIRNACLHSKASQLSIELRYASELSISFRDNGIGIDPEVVDVGKAGHFGIQGMRERSARLHARITIKSTLNAGTAITLQVPGSVVYRYGNRSLWTKLRWLGRGRSAHLDGEESDSAGR